MPAEAGIRRQIAMAISFPYAAYVSDKKDNIY
jgi:hypothetical protein